jgi:hypothetical protein
MSKPLLSSSNNSNSLMNMGNKPSLLIKQLILLLLVFGVTQHVIAQTSNTGIGYIDNTNTVGIWSSGSASSTPVISLTAQETVGIGTNTPPAGFKLAVTGSALFTRVKVQEVSAWPDYVFKKTYRLPTLSYTENFIKKYQHLPGVPSAAEVKQNGIDVSETQAILLKKIEELTLYIIEQNKKIEEQAERLELLEKKMSSK